MIKHRFAALVTLHLLGQPDIRLVPAKISRNLLVFRGHFTGAFSLSHRTEILRMRSEKNAPVNPDFQPGQNAKKTSFAKRSERLGFGYGQSMSHSYS